MYLPAFPQIAGDLGVSVSSVQLTLATFLAGLACGQLLFGPWSDRRGRRAPLLFGSLLFALAAAACALTHSIGGLLFFRFLMGLGGAAGQVVARAVVRDRFDEAASVRMFSAMMLVMAIAPVLAPLLGGAILAHGERFGGWHLIFWIQAAFGLCCVAVVFLDLLETLPLRRRARGGPAAVLRHYLRILPDRRFLGYALAAACGSGILFAYISASPFVFITLHGFSPQEYSLLFAANAIALFGTARLNSLLRRRWNARALLKRAFVVTALAGIALIVVAGTGWDGPHSLFLVIPLLVCLGALGLIFPNAAAAALRPFARKAGTASALLGTIQYTVGSLSGTLVGLLFTDTALPMAGMIALCAGTGAVAIVLLVPKRSGNAAIANIETLP